MRTKERTHKPTQKVTGDRTHQQLKSAEVSVFCSIPEEEIERRRVASMELWGVKGIPNPELEVRTELAGFPVKQSNMSAYSYPTLDGRQSGKLRMKHISGAAKTLNYRVDKLGFTRSAHRHCIRQKAALDFYEQF